MEENKLDLLHGVTVPHDVTLHWVLVGTLDEASAFELARNAAGVYAFLAENGCALYVGKAGGLKPGERDRWAQDISGRLTQHWKSGPFRGLIRATNAKIQVWIMDLRKALDQIWERDIERIENELIGWLKAEDKNAIPGNTACEGTSARKFVVHIERGEDEPLPRVTLKPGTCPDTRKARKWKTP